MVVDLFAALRALHAHEIIAGVEVRLPIASNGQLRVRLKSPCLLNGRVCCKRSLLNCSWSRAGLVYGPAYKFLASKLKII